LKRHNLRFVTDPSNDNPKYLRARVRNEVLPLLRELSPNVVEHLCQLAQDLHASGIQPVCGFGRAHLKAIAEATDRQSMARIALPAGRTAIWDHQTGRIVIETSDDEASE
jgi:tRNA(Ile)-lysidine synthase